MNLVEKLTREIERVTILREKLLLREVGDDAYKPTPNIAIMTAAIETGHTAAASGDVIDIIAAIKTLERITP